jgi:hypothetical protein
MVSAAFGRNAFSARQHARDELRRSRVADDQAGEKTDQPGEDDEPSTVIEAPLCLMRPTVSMNGGRADFETKQRYEITGATLGSTMGGTPLT